jgi:DNA-binding response OmpR family regulator
LIVEDDAALLAVLQAAMEFGGFDHRSVASGREALEQVRTGIFDAVLMDLGLPDMDGQALLRSLRQISDIPILICSGLNSEQDKIAALDLGADDFIAKPFLPGEMLARIRAVLRRGSGSVAEEQDNFHPQPSSASTRLVIDPDYSVARYNGREVSLSEHEYKVLDRLLHERTGPVSRSMIMETLYGEGEERHSKIVEIYVMRLRRKLKDLTGRDDMIQNFRGRGWALRLD